MNIYHVVWTVKEFENDGLLGGEGRFIDRYFSDFITCRDEYYAECAVSKAYPNATIHKPVYVGEA